MPYRLRAKRLFLTYPQCDRSKEEMLTAMEVKLGTFGIEEYVVAHELHQNGDHHIHMYLHLKNLSLDTSDPHYLDILGYHGNYQACRSPKNVVKYCTKEEDYVSNFDIEEWVKSSSIKRKRIAKALITKEKSLQDVVQEDPSYLFGYKKLKDDLMTYFKDCETDTRGGLPVFLPNPWGLILPSKRDAKRRHYWIFSREPNKGKTTRFAEPLQENYRCYTKAGDFTYWELEGSEEAIILDDYNTPQLKWSYLNVMCDGSCEYRRINRRSIKLNKPLIIILSNAMPKDLYPNSYMFITARFNVYELH